MLTFTCSVAREDRTALAEHILLARDKRAYRLRLVGTSVSVAITVGVFMTFVQSWQAGVIFGGIVGTIVALALPHIERNEIQKAVGKDYPGGASQVTVEVQDSVLGLASPEARSEIRWSAVQEVAFTSKHCMLFFGPRRGLVIPRSSVPDGRQFEAELRRLIDSRKVSGSWSGVTA